MNQSQSNKREKVKPRPAFRHSRTKEIFRGVADFDRPACMTGRLRSSHSALLAL